MKKKVLKIHTNDNVLVALQDLIPKENVVYEDKTYRILERIPSKHKFFIEDLNKEDSVIMYGTLVGKTKKNVKKGMRMSTENIKHAASPYKYRPNNYEWTPPDISQFKNRTFDGYLRSDGRVGTANHWLFIPMVFCENRNLDVIREALHNELGYTVTDKYRQKTRLLRELYQKGGNLENIDLKIHESIVPVDRLFANIDGIKFLNHQGGCGGTRQDSEVLGKLLAGYANHPNVAGVTVLSLGCQNLQIKDFLRELNLLNSNFDKPLHIFEQQRSKNEDQLITEAIRETFLSLIEANKIFRQPASLAKLTIGVKCGGSDGFSGISANPAVGYCADLLVALGGKVLLAEFPELCGAEQDIIDRTVNKPAALKFIKLMSSYSSAAERSGSGFHMNPSPGNIRDGLITDAIKSNGALKKGGHSPIVDVLDYTEPATKNGLSLICTPGNDVESTTGKTASGATLILFTTGLGTPTGNPICPVMKVASNTKIALRMSDIIDFDCGPIISGKKSIKEMGEDLLEYSIKVASGKIIPKAVALNQDDFIPWKRGVSL